MLELAKARGDHIHPLNQVVRWPTLSAQLIGANSVRTFSQMRSVRDRSQLTYLHYRTL